MPTKAREYIALTSVGDLAACRASLAEIERLIRARLHSNLPERRAAFFARILSNEEDVEDEYLDNAKVKELTNGSFPIVWLNITFDPNWVAIAELASLETELSLGLLGEGASDQPFA